MKKQCGDTRFVAEEAEIWEMFISGCSGIAEFCRMTEGVLRKRHSERTVLGLDLVNDSFVHDAQTATGKCHVMHPHENVILWHEHSSERTLRTTEPAIAESSL